MPWLVTRRIPLLLAAATLIPIGALSWLGIRTLQQDRELERQRRRERLEVAAGRLALRQPKSKSFSIETSTRPLGHTVA